MQKTAALYLLARALPSSFFLPKVRLLLLPANRGDTLVLTLDTPRHRP